VLLRASAWAEAHPAEAVALIAAEDGGRLSDALIAEAYPKLATSLTPRLTPDYIAGLDAQKNFLRDWGFLAGDFDINDWIVREPLEEALRIVAAETKVAA
jgi:ABC-type nitrate/sulfonate/bicarbonate transport system substrate-binding protein